MVRPIVVGSFVFMVIIGILALGVGIGETTTPGFLGGEDDPILSKVAGILLIVSGFVAVSLYSSALFVIDGGAWYKRNWS